MMDSFTALIFWPSDSHQAHHHSTGIASVRAGEFGTSYFCIRNSPIFANSLPDVVPPYEPSGSCMTTVTMNLGSLAGMMPAKSAMIELRLPSLPTTSAVPD